MNSFELLEERDTMAPVKPKTDCPTGATLLERTEHFGAQIEVLFKILEKVRGRPTWAVLVIISGLSSLCVGLALALIKAGPTVAAAADMPGG